MRCEGCGWVAPSDLALELRTIVVPVGAFTVVTTETWLRCPECNTLELLEVRSERREVSHADTH